MKCNRGSPQIAAARREVSLKIGLQGFKKAERGCKDGSKQPKPDRYPERASGKGRKLVEE